MSPYFIHDTMYGYVNDPVVKNGNIVFFYEEKMVNGVICKGLSEDKEKNICM